MAFRVAAFHSGDTGGGSVRAGPGAWDRPSPIVPVPLSDSGGGMLRAWNPADAGAEFFRLGTVPRGGGAGGFRLWTAPHLRPVCRMEFRTE